MLGSNSLGDRRVHQRARLVAHLHGNASLACQRQGRRQISFVPCVALLVADLHRAGHGMAKIGPLSAGEGRDVIVGEHQSGRRQQGQSDQSDQSDEECQASCNRGERMAGSSGR